MATMSINDGTQIFYKDWGTGQPIVFSHGWPLSADAWGSQMLFLASHGYRCIAAFSETDFTEDLQRFDVPRLIIHGDDDQIVPIDASARAAAKIVTHATLTVYDGGDHGLADTHTDRLNADLLAFITAEVATALT